MMGSPVELTQDDIDREVHDKISGFCLEFRDSVKSVASNIHAEMKKCGVTCYPNQYSSDDFQKVSKSFFSSAYDQDLDYLVKCLGGRKAICVAATKLSSGELLIASNAEAEETQTPLQDSFFKQFDNYKLFVGNCVKMLSDSDKKVVDPFLKELKALDSNPSNNLLQSLEKIQANLVIAKEARSPSERVLNVIAFIQAIELADQFGMKEYYDNVSKTKMKIIKFWEQDKMKQMCETLALFLFWYGLVTKMLNESCPTGESDELHSLKKKREKELADQICELWEALQVPQALLDISRKVIDLVQAFPNFIEVSYPGGKDHKNPNNQLHCEIQLYLALKKLKMSSFSNFYVSKPACRACTAFFFGVIASDERPSMPATCLSSFYESSSFSRGTERATLGELNTELISLCNPSNPLTSSSSSCSN